MRHKVGKVASKYKGTLSDAAVCGYDDVTVNKGLLPTLIKCLN